MKRAYFYLFLLLSLFSSIIFGQNPPLRVAIESFEPPFIMLGANRQYFGFDISIIEAICKSLDRNCEYKVMRFDEILSAVEQDNADVGISAITITIPRLRQVNFSLPYLLSRSRFIGKADMANQPFTMLLLNNKRIGVESGSVFTNQINDMGIQNPTVTNYANTHEMIDALNSDEIDLALMDNHSVVFWATHSSGILKVLGEPFKFGYGLGIAVNRQNDTLLRQINQALVRYQNSKEYKKTFGKYLGHLLP